MGRIHSRKRQVHEYSEEQPVVITQLTLIYDSQQSCDVGFLNLRKRTPKSVRSENNRVCNRGKFHQPLIPVQRNSPKFCVPRIRPVAYAFLPVSTVFECSAAS